MALDVLPKLVTLPGKKAIFCTMQSQSGEGIMPFGHAWDGGELDVKVELFEVGTRAEHVLDHINETEFDALAELDRLELIPECGPEVPRESAIVGIDDDVCKFGQCPLVQRQEQGSIRGTQAKGGKSR